jgi:protoporphyrinogen oxidase
VPRPTVEEVVSGALGCAERPLGYNAEFLYPRRGIGALSEALARRAGRVETGVRPLRIDVDRKLIHLDGGESVGYRQLVSTIPLDTLLALAEPKPPRVAQAAAALRCVPLRYLDLALRTPVRRDIHWVYVPEARYPFYRVGAYSAFSPEMAPPGRGSLYVELASRGEPDLASLVPRVAADLVEMGLIGSPGDILFARARHIRHAYVLYDHSYRDALDVLRPWLLEHDVRSCGRYGSWEYSAMEDAIRQGRDAALAALEAS